MKPSERIGNLLYNEAGEVTEVVSITKTHINGVELSKWRPIPLTKEGLKRVGFVCRGPWTYDLGVFRPHSGLEHGETGALELIMEYRTKRIIVRWLHQIQNLYFDLTGTDLRIPL